MSHARTLLSKKMSAKPTLVAMLLLQLQLLHIALAAVDERQKPSPPRRPDASPETGPSKGSDNTMPILAEGNGEREWVCGSDLQ